MREFLKGLDLDKETINTIMAEHGKLLTETKENNEKLKEQLRSSNESLTAANSEIERFKGMDIDGIRKAASDWETKFKEAETTANARIADMEYDAALKDALVGERFSSDYAKTGVFNEIKGKKLLIENGKIMGLEDALKAIKESQPTAFVSENAKIPATAIYGGAGKTPINPTELDGIKAEYEAAQKARNSTRMVEIRMEAKQNGYQIE